MSSLKVVIGIIIFDIVLAVLFSQIGADIAYADTGFNDSGVVSSVDNISLNASDVTVASAPGFIKSFTFGINSLPSWMQILLLIPQIMLVLAVVWWIRGV